MDHLENKSKQKYELRNGNLDTTCHLYILNAVLSPLLVI